jgi:hypothetical protein
MFIARTLLFGAHTPYSPEVLLTPSFEYADIESMADTVSGSRNARQASSNDRNTGSTEKGMRRGGIW